MARTNPALKTLTADQTIGRRVHQLMWDRKITARELAPHIGVDPTGLGRRLRGERGWSADEIVDAAAYFGVTTDYLFWLDADEDVKLPHLDSNQEPIVFQPFGASADGDNVVRPVFGKPLRADLGMDNSPAPVVPMHRRAHPVS